MKRTFSPEELSLLLIEPNDNDWQRVVEYVHARYEKAFDAHLTTYMPHFTALEDQAGVIKSLCGFRSAQTEQLFLENYLTEKAERILSEKFELDITREKLVEFGQLASFTRGISSYHFLLMTEKLVEMGFEWCIFTATDLLHAMMKHIGLPLVVIAQADPSHIPDATKIWGSYYQHQPRIVAGNLVEGARYLRTHFNEMFFTASQMAESQPNESSIVANHLQGNTRFVRNDYAGIFTKDAS